MEEDHKNAERAAEQADKLNARLKKMKTQLEEAVSKSSSLELLF